jgi:OOP family OmpA-OmpF porin
VLVKTNSMKKIKTLLFTFFLAFFLSSLSAQQTSFGVHGTATEYIGDLNNHNYSLYKFKYFKPGGALSLQWYLNPSFNLVGRIGYDKVHFPSNLNPVLSGHAGVEAYFITANAMLKYKTNNGYLLPENAAIAPFAIGGLGVTRINGRPVVNGVVQTEYYPAAKGQMKPNLAIGGGIFFRFNDAFGIEASSIFNRPFYDEWDGIVRGGNDIYLQHSLGLIFSLKKPADTDKDGVPDKRDSCSNTPPGIQVDTKGCPIDTDGDGVADHVDKCPQQHGTAALSGCPDTDNDGVADQDDKCPAVPGLAKFAGCPDTDGDGVEDSADKCPNTEAGTPVDASGCPLDSDGDKVPDNLDKCPNTPAGTAVDETGCPVDSDGDGVPNKTDRCPNTPGPATNNGCPEVKPEVKKRLNFATRGIFFETGKATLKPASFPKLDEVVSIINEYTDYNLRLGGHTDNVGSDAANLKLSQARVDAVKAYLVSKGVPDTRLDATGYGETKPIATNKTAVGRAQNRRVEMELYLK